MNLCELYDFIIWCSYNHHIKPFLHLYCSPLPQPASEVIALLISWRGMSCMFSQMLWNVYGKPIEKLCQVVLLVDDCSQANSQLCFKFVNVSDVMYFHVELEETPMVKPKSFTDCTSQPTALHLVLWETWRTVKWIIEDG